MECPVLDSTKYKFIIFHNDRSTHNTSTRLVYENIFICSLDRMLMAMLTFHRIDGHLQKSKHVFHFIRISFSYLLHEGSDLCPFILGHHLLETTVVAGHVDAQLLVPNLYKDLNEK